LSLLGGDFATPIAGSQAAPASGMIWSVLTKPTTRSVETTPMADVTDGLQSLKTFGTSGKAMAA